MHSFVFGSCTVRDRGGDENAREVEGTIVEREQVEDSLIKGTAPKYIMYIMHHVIR